MGYIASHDFPSGLRRWDVAESTNRLRSGITVTFGLPAKAYDQSVFSHPFHNANSTDPGTDACIQPSSARDVSRDMRLGYAITCIEWLLLPLLSASFTIIPVHPSSAFVPIPCRNIPCSNQVRSKSTALPLPPLSPHVPSINREFARARMKRVASSV